MQIDGVPAVMEQAIRDLRTSVASACQTSEATSTPEGLKLIREDIIIHYYFGPSALIHRQSYLCFFNKRGAINWLQKRGSIDNHLSHIISYQKKCLYI